MPDHVNLSACLTHPAAAEMLLLARGQLNRAFRANGLFPPDPLLAVGLSCIDSGELDDPAAAGVERARARYGEAFTSWTEEMPLKLVSPVLDILWRTRQALDRRPGSSKEAAVAVSKAYELLLDCSGHDPGQPGGGVAQEIGRMGPTNIHAGG